MDEVLEFSCENHSIALSADWRLPEPIKDFAITQGSECFISGGVTKSGSTNAVYVINENGPVRQLPQMLEARAQHSLVLFDGETDASYKLYAIGGSINLIELYDAAADHWVMLDLKVPTNLGVFGASCCLLPSGMILISGG